jgi:hypothetical protein
MCDLAGRRGFGGSPPDSLFACPLLSQKSSGSSCDTLCFCARFARTPPCNPFLPQTAFLSASRFFALASLARTLVNWNAASKAVRPSSSLWRARRGSALPPRRVDRASIFWMKRCVGYLRAKRAGRKSWLGRFFFGALSLLERSHVQQQGDELVVAEPDSRVQRLRRVGPIQKQLLHGPQNLLSGMLLLLLDQLRNPGPRNRLGHGHGHGCGPRGAVGGPLVPQAVPPPPPPLVPPPRPPQPPLARQVRLGQQRLEILEGACERSEHKRIVSRGGHVSPAARGWGSPSDSPPVKPRFCRRRSFWAAERNPAGRVGVRGVSPRQPNLFRLALTALPASWHVALMVALGRYSLLSFRSNLRKTAVLTR